MIADAVAPAVTRNPYGDHESREGLLVAFGGNNQSGPIEVATAVNAHGGPSGRMDFESETFVAHALRGEGFDASEDGTGRGTPIVPVFAPSTAATLTRGAESAGKGGYAGRRQEDETNIVAYGLRADASRSGEAKTPSIDSAGVPRLRDAGFNLCEGHAPTLEAGSPPSVAFSISQNSNGFAWESDVNPTLQARAQSETANQIDGVRQGWAVRRLMPIECERLQGFPDNFTNVPWRGKDHAPDGPRYKALGNSMACNCMSWIGKRIDLMEKLIASGKVPT